MPVDVMYSTQECPVEAPSHFSDGVLVQQALAGDAEAFERLVQRYHRQLFQLIFSYVKEYHDAYDILQEIVLQLYLSLGTLRLAKSLHPWLHRVARNRCIDYLRRKRPIYFFSELEAEGKEYEQLSFFTIVDTHPLPEEVVEQHETQQQVQRAIQALPPHYRQVIHLHCIAQLSFGEIGRLLKLPETTVKSNFYRAWPLLRAALVVDAPDWPDA